MKGPCPSTCKLCPHSPRTGSATGSWAEFVCRGGLSDQKLKRVLGTFLRIEKLSFLESVVKIRDIEGIPNEQPDQF